MSSFAFVRSAKRHRLRKTTWQFLVKYIPTKPKGPTPRYYPREIKGYVHTKPIHKML